MVISYSEPLSRAWSRMKKALFQPFDINKWFRVGFTAWLAGLTDCNGGNGGGGGKNSGEGLDEFFTFPQTAYDWLLNHPVWFNLIIAGVILLIIVISVIIWVSSRGRFMFLHNVALDKADISFPWKEYRKEGNSLFIWNFIVGWLFFAVLILFFIHSFKAGKELYYGDYLPIETFWTIAQLVLIFLGIIIVFGYISLFLKDFVVPVMYKNRIGVLAGWSKFLSLFGRYILTFIVYGLFIFALGIAVAIAVVIAGLFTCCIGLFLIAIPYIGAVILLPVSYTFRALSIEFLAQFGNEYNVFPEEGNIINNFGESKTGHSY